MAMSSRPNAGPGGRRENAGIPGKWLLGCGCMTVMLIVCTGGVGVAAGGWYLSSGEDGEQATRSSKENSEERIKECRKLLRNPNATISEQWEACPKLSELE